MNEQLQQALTAILNKTMQGVDAGASFLSDQLPDVIHQLLVYKAASSAIEIVFLLLFLVGHVLFWRYYMKTENEFWKDGYGPAAPTIVVGIVGGLLSVIFVIAIIVDIQIIVQIWLAPKIYLIEYAAKLASPSK